MKTFKLYLPMILLLLLLLTAVLVPGCSCSQPGTSSSKPGSSVPVAEEKGDPDWWKKQPDLKKEETAINETLSGVRAALMAKDADIALTYIAPDDREKFKAVLAKSPDILPRMAKDMENAALSFLSLDTDNTLDRIAEYAMKVDGNTFYIVFIKTGGKWFIKNF
jgi:hypothetical protein